MTIDLIIKEREMKKLTMILISLCVVAFFGCGGNEAPVIESVETNRTEVEPGGEIAINVTASDPDGDELTYVYEISSGEIIGTGSIVTWVAPQMEGGQFIKVTIRDEENWTQESIKVDVIAKSGDECPFSFSIETESTTASGVNGIGTLTQGGNPIQGATVEVKNCDTGQSGSATTNAQGQIRLGNVFGRVMPEHTVKITATHNGVTCVWCFQPSDQRWRRVPCPTGC